MFGIGFQEITVILIVVLIIFGPKRLPELAKLLGKGLAEFRRATDDIKSAIDLENLKSYPPARPKSHPRPLPVPESEIPLYQEPEEKQKDATDFPDPEKQLDYGPIEDTYE